MKFVILLVVALTASVLTTGCGAIYSTIVDTRDVQTIVSDNKIRAQITKRLSRGEFSDLLNVSVTSFEGDVFLVGEYESVVQRDRFVAAANEVEGVESISTHFVKVDYNNPCSTKQNVAITSRVRASLVKDNSIWSTNVNVRTIQCHVVLWGTVGTAEEVEKSVLHAKAVEGVLSVKSYLKSRNH